MSVSARVNACERVSVRMSVLLHVFMIVRLTIFVYCGNIKCVGDWELTAESCRYTALCPKRPQCSLGQKSGQWTAQATGGVYVAQLIAWSVYSFSVPFLVSLDSTPDVSLSVCVL